METKNLFKFGDWVQKIKNAEQSAASFWVRRQRLIFIVFFLLIALSAVFIWYKSLYLSGWSEEKKAQYVASQTRDINLKEGEFQKALADIEKRKEIYNSEYNPIKDIFKPY